jgi:hypothetical protein
VREIPSGDVSFFRRRRFSAEDLIAVRVTAESGDDLAYVASLIHQRLVYRLKGSGRFRRYLFAKPDEQIDAREVIRAFAMAKGLTVDDSEPGHASDA